MVIAGHGRARWVRMNGLHQLLACFLFWTSSANILQRIIHSSWKGNQMNWIYNCKPCLMSSLKLQRLTFLQTEMINEQSIHLTLVFPGTTLAMRSHLSLVPLGNCCSASSRSFCWFWVQTPVSPFSLFSWGPASSSSTAVGSKSFCRRLLTFPSPASPTADFLFLFLTVAAPSCSSSPLSSSSQAALSLWLAMLSLTGSDLTGGSDAFSSDNLTRPKTLIVGQIWKKSLQILCRASERLPEEWLTFSLICLTLVVTWVGRHMLNLLYINTNSFWVRSWLHGTKCDGLTSVTDRPSSWAIFSQRPGVPPGNLTINLLRKLTSSSVQSDALKYKKTGRGGVVNLRLWPPRVPEDHMTHWRQESNWSSIRPSSSWTCGPAASHPFGLQSPQWMSSDCNFAGSHSPMLVHKQEIPPLAFWLLASFLLHGGVWGEWEASPGDRAQYRGISKKLLQLQVTKIKTL